MSDLINFAHRGAAGYYPENTMLAFAKALELGATGIETDVQMTRDGELVLIHDETLQRTAGTPEWIKDLTLTEIKQREAGSWFREEFAGERIPTLEELLDLVRNTDTIVNLELKTGVVLYPGIEQKVLDTVRRFGLSERIIISSFNHYSLVECKKLAPDIRTGILYMEGLYEPWDYAKRVGADALHAYQYALTPELVAEAKANGVVYHPFTVNDTKLMQALIAAGVAGIITDYPDRLAELLVK
ncbi:glycerophosphodiester phosphodiesterase [Paenibacillus sp. p3-SID1389]|uniref:glycerophosphodiester phosphodiesterase n=1 Tax=Paenibacillus sp. p3-SID1389 TaxID=2916364 RepID=UPI0021A53B6B|nr:glycerophosphodiester phosphodiesterase [Paenibacillus sp. p3-SID1389]MCT2197250.1 glycerophosphodiester phosphodiesterase [Paenibacillus sp. p3-SID1389]